MRIYLNPSSVLTDFEIAATGAFEFHFSNVESLGCHFHFAQSIYKKVVELGLKTHYDTNNTDLKTWIQKVAALDDTADYAKLKELCDYFQNTYIDKMYANTKGKTYLLEFQEPLLQ